jgi:hypothetical protein
MNKDPQGSPRLQIRQVISFAPSLEASGEINPIMDRPSNHDPVRISQFSDLGVGLEDRLQGIQEYRQKQKGLN